MNAFQEYLSRKWPQYRQAVTDGAVTASVLCKLGQITEQERDETFDVLLISKSDREMLVKSTDQCAPQKNAG